MLPHKEHLTKQIADLLDKHFNRHGWHGSGCPECHALAEKLFRIMGNSLKSLLKVLILVEERWALDEGMARKGELNLQTPEDAIFLCREELRQVIKRFSQKLSDHGGCAYEPDKDHIL